MARHAHAYPELSLGQARAIAHIRSRWPGAQVTLHERRWGFVAEVHVPRRAGGRRTIVLARFDSDGRIGRDRSIALAS